MTHPTSRPIKPRPGDYCFRRGMLGPHVVLDYFVSRQDGWVVFTSKDSLSLTLNSERGFLNKKWNYLKITERQRSFLTPFLDCPWPKLNGLPQI